MIQNILVLIALLGATIYLVVYVIRMHSAKNNKCTGCAVNKIYQMKLENSKSIR